MKNKETRQKEALARKQEYNTLTTSQKIVLLDMKFGKGIGAVKQRNKLSKVVELIKQITPEGGAQRVPKKFYQKPKKS